MRRWLSDAWDFAVVGGGVAFFVALAVGAFLAVVLGLAYGVVYVVSAAWHAGVQ